MVDYNELEVRWQKAWADAKVFESEPSDKPALLVFAAFPYINNPLHIGHLRTFGTADTYARYMRMKGYNVLYPMGFHATGTPLIGFAKRIANKDQELINELRMFHMRDDDIARMSDLEFIKDYFIRFQEHDFSIIGFSIDWRRKFVSTDPLFSKLVEWQFANLKELGFLVQGSHPVGWCTNEGNAVGQHDTKHDVQPKIEELTAVKFKEPETGISFPCSTYRPETIYGVTNLFVNQDATYVVAKAGNDRYYLAKDAAEALKYQMSIEIESQINGSDLLAKKATNPITGDIVPIFPGYFVKTDVGTGVVMSVPAHAPFDYAALEKLRERGFKMEGIQYKNVLEIKRTDGQPVSNDLLPAHAYLTQLGADYKAPDQVLENATKLAYREESHWGVMIVGKYTGMKEPQARDAIKADLIKSNDAFPVYEIANEEPVICRCGYKVIVNIVHDQWFIDYGNNAWKEKVMEVLKKMSIYPEKYEKTFENVVEWIELRAAERAQGLGTKFPYNPKHIIESLSDSTIYVTFYTFVHILRIAGVKPDQLKPEFFDYVINGKGSLESVASSTGIDAGVLKKCRDSLDYWYRNTSSHSAYDLVYNHLTMYIFNHVALLNKEYSPKQIVVNGMVNYEGAKMSKSLGNIVPVVDAVKRYGSDPMRFVELCGADLDIETDFKADSIGSVTARNQFLMDIVDELETMQGSELGSTDYWLYSKLNMKIKNVTKCMDELQFRSAYTDAFYNSVSELKSYTESGGNNQMVVKEFLEKVTLMLGPIMPHVAEELWHRLGNQTLVAKEMWPVADEKMINEAVEAVAGIVESTLDDITKAVDLTSKIPQNSGKKVASVRIIVADQWKISAYNTLVAEKDISKALAKLGSANKEAAAKFLSQFAKNIKTLVPIPEIKSEDLYNGFVQSKERIEKRFGAVAEIEMEGSSKSTRAARSMPQKPSIDITWN